MWALAPDAYLRVVDDAGWPVERFRADYGKFGISEGSSGSNPRMGGR